MTSLLNSENRKNITRTNFKINPMWDKQFHLRFLFPRTWKIGLSRSLPFAANTFSFTMISTAASMNILNSSACKTKKERHDSSIFKAVCFPKDDDDVDDKKELSLDRCHRGFEDNASPAHHRLLDERQPCPCFDNGDNNGRVCCIEETNTKPTKATPDFDSATAASTFRKSTNNPLEPMVSPWSIMGREVKRQFFHSSSSNFHKPNTAGTNPTQTTSLDDGDGADVTADDNILGEADKDWELFMSTCGGSDDGYYHQYDSGEGEDDYEIVGAYEPIPIDFYASLPAPTPTKVAGTEAVELESLPLGHYSKLSTKNQTPKNIARGPNATESSTAMNATSRGIKRSSHKFQKQYRGIGGDCNTISSSNKRTKRSSMTVVGPKSTQMLSIKRMLIYLEETSDRSSNADNTVAADDSVEYLNKQVLAVVAECQARHVAGESKFMNLPGAIFERLVKEIGGPAFGRIYKASQDFHHPRIAAIEHAMEASAGNNETPGRCSQDLDWKKKLSASAEVGRPNLLQVAVGYGFHLARLSLMEEKLQEKQHIAGVTKRSNKELFEKGAKFVLNMQEDEQVLFWKYMVESPLFHKQMKVQELPPSSNEHELY